ncbi:tRNA lysidine(34) synthetase TilS [Persephonella sp.]
MVEKKFLKAVKDFQLVEPEDRILVAFSGGVDSVVLTHLFLKFKDHLKISSVGIAHFNHMLRGKEAEEDSRFAQEFAVKNGIPFYYGEEDVKKYAEENSLSVEEAGRSLRYRFLNRILKQNSYSKLATGHHLSDLIETMLLWFIQGNKRGIKGFKPKEDQIVRPLYYLKKEEIISYADRCRLEYRTDTTNFSTEILRNRLRIEIIPQLKKINRSLEESMLLESLFLQMDEDFLDREADRFSQKFLKNYIELKELKKLPDALVYRVLTEWVYRNTGVHPSYRKLLEIMKIIKKTGEKELNIGKGFILIKSYDRLIITEKPEKKEFLYRIRPGEEIYIKESGIILKSYIVDAGNRDMKELKDEKKKVCFDIRDESPVFTIRNRKEGDRFLPFGRSTEKKLKDVLINLKVPRFMRDNIPLLEFRNKILWIVGYRRSAYYPVTDNTEKMICFEIKEV